MNIKLLKTANILSRIASCSNYISDLIMHDIDFEFKNLTQTGHSLAFITILA